MSGHWTEEGRAGYLAQVMAMIDRHGHATQGVFATTPDEIPFVYTVGLCSRLGCEFLIAGLDTHLAAGMLNDFADTIVDGWRPVEGELVACGANVPFRLTAMDGHRAPVTTATALYGYMPMWQLVWPDPAGDYPPEAEAKFIDAQRVKGSLL